MSDPRTITAAVSYSSLQGANKDLSDFIGKGLAFTNPKIENGPQEAAVDPVVVTTIEFKESAATTDNATSGEAIVGRGVLVMSLEDAIFLGGNLLALGEETIQKHVAELNVSGDMEDAIGECYNIFVGGMNKAVDKVLHSRVSLFRVASSILAEGGATGLETMDLRLCLELDAGRGSSGPVTLGLDSQAVEKLAAVGGDFLTEDEATAILGTKIATHKRQAQQAAERPTYKILLVDDVAIIREKIRRILESFGHEVIIAKGGGEGVKRALLYKVDLVLMDIVMPDLDGITAVKEIRKRKSRADLPIIMCSSMGRRSYVVDAIKSGADDYIVKPAPGEMIAKKILAVMARRDALRAKAQEEGAGA